MTTNLPPELVRLVNESLWSNGDNRIPLLVTRRWDLGSYGIHLRRVGNR